MRASTPRGGMHAYFRAPEDAPRPAQNLFGIGLDVRSRASLLIASPSYSAEHDRHWQWTGDVVPPGELPEIPAALIRPRALFSSQLSQTAVTARDHGRAARFVT